jgi:hypothetical protein
MFSRRCQTAAGQLVEVFIEFDRAGHQELSINGIDASFDGLKAHIFSDRNSNEVYIDGGIEYRTYRREPENAKSARAEIASKIPITSRKIYRLKSIWK